MYDIAARLVFPINDRALIKILKKNVRADLRRDLLFHQIEDLNHLRELCREHEQYLRDTGPNNNFQRRDFRNDVRKERYHIAEITEQDEDQNDIEPTDEIAAVGQTGSNNEIVCWNCNKVGHKFYKCNKKLDLFCWSCGKREFTKFTCPDCGPGNIQRNEQKNLLPRSSVQRR
jgi:hypothetical protein